MNGSRVERTVVVKSILKREGASKAELDFVFGEFLKEVKIVQALGKHPNVLEYIGTLAQNLSRCNKFMFINQKFRKQIIH